MRVEADLGGDSGAGLNRSLRPVGPAAADSLIQAVAVHLAEQLPLEAPHRPWVVFASEHKRVLSGFKQYEHLPQVQAVVNADRTGTLLAELGTDYPASPDVAVGLEMDEHHPFLHAAIACLWTIDPEDVPAIKAQGALLNRHRRGRQPHVIVVTAEPLPTRLAALGRGTGEIDGIYHVALQELEAAAVAMGDNKQSSCLRELIDQNRLFDLSRLASVIATY